MSDQAKALRGLMERRDDTPDDRVDPADDSKTQTIAVTSGKGGVGKSNIALNLAIALAATDSSVCLLDANLGLGSIDLLCGLNGYWNLSHVVTGARTIKDILLEGPGGIKVVPGASGLKDIADCPPAAQREIFGQLDELERTHDFLIVDTGPGIHRAVREFVTLADVVLLVTTPEPTSIADAYATIKTLSASKIPELQLLVNQSESTAQAQNIIERLQQTARLFLRTEVAAAGHIPADYHVPGAVKSRVPLQIGSPHSAAARSIQQLARQMKSLAGVSQRRAPFFPRFRDRFVDRVAEPR